MRTARHGARPIPVQPPQPPPPTLPSTSSAPGATIRRSPGQVRQYAAPIPCPTTSQASPFSFPGPVASPGASRGAARSGRAFLALGGSRGSSGALRPRGRRGALGGALGGLRPPGPPGGAFYVPAPRGGLIRFERYAGLEPGQEPSGAAGAGEALPGSLAVAAPGT